MTPLEKNRTACILANPAITEPTYCGSPCHCLQAETEERPIRLADVLLAIHKKDFGKIDAVSEMLLDMAEERKEHLMSAVYRWNLLKDDLTQQSEETIRFIASLL